MVWGRKKVQRVELPREARARRRAEISGWGDWCFAFILTLVLFAGSAFMIWYAYDVARAGVPHTLTYRTGGGRTVSATHAAVYYSVIGGIALVVALGNLKFMLTGSAWPFLSVLGYGTRREPRLRQVPDGKTCPYCGYSREGMAWADLCPECGKNSGM